MQATTERRQAILEYLCECKETTTQEIAHRFGVCEKTIYTDLLILSCSYPVFTRKGGRTEKGNGGGVYVPKNYQLHKDYLSDKQVDVLQRLKSKVSDEEQEIIDSIIQKFALKK